MGHLRQQMPGECDVNVLPPKEGPEAQPLPIPCPSANGIVVADPAVPPNEKLEDHPAGAVAEALADGSRVLSVGSAAYTEEEVPRERPTPRPDAKVIIHSIVSKPEINGTEGVLLRWLEEWCRWVCRLRNGEIVNLRVQNFDVVQTLVQETVVQAQNVATAVTETPEYRRREKTPPSKATASSPKYRQRGKVPQSEVEQVVAANIERPKHRQCRKAAVNGADRPSEGQSRQKKIKM